MDIKISNADGKTRFAEQSQSFLKELRASKTKSKDTKESDFKYRFSWGEAIETESLFDTLNAVGKPRQKPPLKERIDARIKRSEVCLIITAGRFSRYYKVEIPPEVINVINDDEVDDDLMDLEVAGLTDAERNERIENCLRALRGSPGFHEFRVPIHD